MQEIRNQQAYEETIGKGVTLMDFNAPWCAPCRAQEPILEKISKQYNGKAKVAAMNIDQNTEVASKLGIQSIPTLILFKDGKEIQRFVGLQSEDVLAQTLERFIH